jgi:hypothetical protein
MQLQRNKKVDFPYPSFVDGINLVLPYPSQLANTAAPLAPFVFQILM